MALTECHSEMDAAEPASVGVAATASCNVLGTTEAASDGLWLQREAFRRLISKGGSWPLPLPRISDGPQSYKTRNQSAIPTNL